MHNSSGPENSAKAPRGISEGPAGAVRQGRTVVRHKTAQKSSNFWAAGIIPVAVSVK